jgi:uncharacterized lipoprotein YmbA
MLRRDGGERRNPRIPRAGNIIHAARLMGCCAVRAIAPLLCSLGDAGVLALAAALVFGGCSALSPKPDRTRFILLAPTTAGGSSSAQLAAGPNLTSLAIALGPIQLPEYLDRPELVIRTSPNGLQLSETNRWAEPLADNFRHVLANDLTNLLGTTNIVQYPWYPGTRLNYIVRGEVQRFEASTNKTAQLIAHWDLRMPQNNQVLANREAQISCPLSSLDGDTIAAALSKALAELAAQISSTIAEAAQ